VTVNDRLEQEELFRVDLLIVCPTSFSLIFKIPTLKTNQLLKTFDIYIQDVGGTNYSIHLTHLFLPSCGATKSESKRTQRCDVTTSRLNCGECPSSHASSSLKTNTFKGDFNGRQPQRLVGPLSLLVIGGLMCNVLAVSLCIYLCADKSKSSTKSSAGKEPSCAPGKHGVRCCRSRQRTIVTVLYVVFRLIYSLSLSMTALYLGFSLLCESDVRRMSTVRRFYRDELRLMSAQVVKSVGGWEREGTAWQGRQIRDRLRACSNYIGELLLDVFVCVTLL